MIAHSINQAFARGLQEQWWKIYVAVDIHGVIFPSTSDVFWQRKYVPYAKETLRYLSSRRDVDLMMFTCSWDSEILSVSEMLERDGIKFKFFNQNPEVLNDARGNYEFKPYYNVLLDDKAGFEVKEWKDVLRTFHKHPLLKRICIKHTVDTNDI